MAKCDLYNMTGEVIGDIELSDAIFGLEEISEASIHAAVVNIQANKRQGTQSTKTRSEVRGGGRKPWRQKGTGRARHGSIRSPIWVKGGVALGPKPRSYNYTLPKKVKRLALKSALTSKLNDNSIIVLNELVLDEIKTKAMVNVLNNLKIDASALVVTAEKNENVIRSTNNIPLVKTSVVNTINVYDILRYNTLILTKDAVEKIEEVYA